MRRAHPATGAGEPTRCKGKLPEDDNQTLIVERRSRLDAVWVGQSFADKSFSHLSLPQQETRERAPLTELKPASEKVNLLFFVCSLFCFKEEFGKLLSRTVKFGYKLTACRQLFTAGYGENLVDDIIQQTVKQTVKHLQQTVKHASILSVREILFTISVFLKFSLSSIRLLYPACFLFIEIAFLAVWTHILDN